MRLPFRSRTLSTETYYIAVVTFISAGDAKESMFISMIFDVVTMFLIFDFGLLHD